MRTEALRTGLTAAGGASAAFALVLAFRRQRATEHAADGSQHDAAERRITELYTKAVEQLGSKQAPVRLGGLYALERLAQDVPQQRQTIVNVFCAYLRMPYELPDRKPSSKVEMEKYDEYREQIEEREVRLTAQRILASHLRETQADRFWVDIDLNLTGATLIDFDLNGCTVNSTAFDDAVFVEISQFDNTTFNSEASFCRTQFTNQVSFEKATFDDKAFFRNATFADFAWFSDVTFTGNVYYDDDGDLQYNGGVTFDCANFKDAHFDKVTCSGPAWLDNTQFRDHVTFEDCTFCGITLDKAQLDGGVSIRRTTFSMFVEFTQLSCADTAHFVEVSFTRDVGLDAAFLAGISFDKCWAKLDSTAMRNWPAGWELSTQPTPHPGSDGEWCQIIPTVNTGSEATPNPPAATP